MAVRIQTNPRLVQGRERELFDLTGFSASNSVSAYDIDGTGERFIMVTGGQIRTVNFAPKSTSS